MTLCPIAIAVGCKKCPVFAVCPLKSVIGDYRSRRRPRAAPHPARASPARSRRSSSPRRTARRRKSAACDTGGRGNPRATPMTYAAITGWGKCMPPSVLTNADLATFLDTDDEWITDAHRHPRAAHLARRRASRWRTSPSARALACAGLAAKDVDLIVYGSCSNDEQVPNSASGLQLKLGAANAAAMDVNTACTSFLYSLSTATAMIRTGVVRNAVVVGVEADLAVHGLDATATSPCSSATAPPPSCCRRPSREEGVLAEKLGCYADARQTLRVRGMGTTYANRGVMLGDTHVGFRRPGNLQARRARHEPSASQRRAREERAHASTTSTSSSRTRRTCASSKSVAKRIGAPMERVFLTVQRYGNMSAATVPVALVEALEEGRVKPGALILMPAFGGGLTWCSHLIRWGERDDAARRRPTPSCRLPTQTALERDPRADRRHEAARTLRRRARCAGVRRRRRRSPRTDILRRRAA